VHDLAVDTLAMWASTNEVGNGGAPQKQLRSLTLVPVRSQMGWSILAEDLNVRFRDLRDNTLSISLMLHILMAKGCSATHSSSWLTRSR
jgi:hypothetical protein